MTLTQSADAPSDQGPDGPGRSVEGNATLPIPNQNVRKGPSTPFSGANNNPAPPAAPATIPPAQDAEPDLDIEDDDDSTPSSKMYDEQYVKDLRREAASRRKALREAESQLQALSSEKQQAEQTKLKNKGELEKVVSNLEADLGTKDAKINELQNMITRGRREMFISAAAAEFKAHNQVDPNFLSLVAQEELFDDDNDDATMQNLVKVFTNMKTEKPYLFVEEEKTIGQGPKLTPNSAPKAPQLSTFSPQAGGSNPATKSDADRLANIRHRMGQRSTLFGNMKTF